MQENTFTDKINSIMLKKRKTVEIVKNDFPVFVDTLQKTIGYSFKNLSLLIHALTHKSAITPEHDPIGLSSNERLELLGDSVLDLLVIEELFARRPKLTEGQMTSIKSLVVSRKILGQVAEKLNLQEALILGKSYENLKTVHTDVASNAFEALIAAIYLDSGDIAVVRNMLQVLFFPFIDDFVKESDNINYKSIILEFVQSKGYPSAVYTVLNESGPDHKKIFKIGIEINSKNMGVATASNKKTAEQKAAKIAAEKLNLL
jgi:ribonuclease-3